MFKRVFLFLATNLAVLALVSIVMSILGVNPQSFGGLLVMVYDFHREQSWWGESLELLVGEVMPHFRG